MMKKEIIVCLHSQFDDIAKTWLQSGDHFLEVTKKVELGFPKRARPLPELPDESDE